MEKIKFELGDVYLCNRLRQLNYLLDHGFKPLEKFTGIDGKFNWAFTVTDELINSLNEFARIKFEEGYAKGLVVYEKENK